MTLAPHPFTLRQLQYVIAVADERSFRRAAERCGVSQPSLSAQLAQVEDALGVRLFERAKKPVLLTLSGSELVDRARRLLVAADDVVAAAKRAADPLAGTLHVGLIPTISPYLLPKIAPALRRKFPKLTFAWVEDRTDALIQKLTAGALEAAILALEAEVGDVEHEVIATDPFVFVAPKGHRLAEGAAISSSALRGEEVLLLDEGHCFRNQALEVCGTARESEFRATSLSTLVQMVAAGAGVTLLPELALPMEASRATLRARPLSSSAAHRTIALVWRRRSPLEGTLRAVAAVLRDAYPAAKAPRGIK